ncbi:hypothetical protein ACH4NT_03980 [Streptomyces lydicus]|uniref:hypothetical protein n=1 Tax=Streptomyces lydicus TaxID=47763 RepID=UPI0037B9DDDE
MGSASDRTDRVGAARDLRRLGGDRGRTGGSAAGGRQGALEVFGGGVFSDSVYFLGRDEGVSFDFLKQWRVSLTVDQDSKFGDVSAVDPYAVYAPGGKGLVEWGSTEWADEYCWLIDAERPGDYPVLARAHDVGGWHRYDISTSEFLYRVLADADFQPFGIAQYDLDTTFTPGSGDDE